jgi:hypothetical protein
MDGGPRWLWAALVLVASTTGVAGEWKGGIGVIGDSYSDEYRFYPPDRSRARNWVEILAETRGLNFGRYANAPRDEPRGPGYAFNWARSAATTAAALAQGQHTGLASQAASGEVALACVFLGGNDIIEALHAPDPLVALPRAAGQASANLDQIVATLLRASPDLMVAVVTIPDVLELPEFAARLADGTLPRAWAAAATEAQRSYNAHIKKLPERDRRIVVIDLFLSQQVARMLAPKALTIDGRKIVREGPSNDYDHLFLADGRHAGTVAQGLIARLFLATFNARFGAGIRPLDDREILDIASRAPDSPPILVEGPPSQGHPGTSVRVRTVSASGAETGS